MHFFIKLSNRGGILMHCQGVIVDNSIEYALILSGLVGGRMHIWCLCVYLCVFGNSAHFVANEIEQESQTNKFRIKYNWNQPGHDLL